MGDPYIFAPTDPGTWIRSVDGTWRRAPDAAVVPGERYAPVAVPAAASAAAERNPDIMRKIEEHNERLIAFLRDRLPSPSRWPPPDYAKITQSSESIAASLVTRGTFRIYFNRHGSAPLVWCVAPVLLGDRAGWELAVASVSIRTLVCTVYQPKATSDDEDGRPSAWIVATGVLTVRDGDAVIDSDETPEVATP